MEYYCCTIINKNNGLLVNFICRYRPSLFILCLRSYAVRSVTQCFDIKLQFMVFKFYIIKCNVSASFIGCIMNVRDFEETLLGNTQYTIVERYLHLFLVNSYYLF